MVIDADGLWLVQEDPEVVKGYKKAVLTPNVVEFKRLCDAVVCNTPLFISSLGYTDRYRLDRTSKTTPPTLPLLPPALPKLSAE